MDSAEEVAPTAEVVKALMDYLVDPMLPLKVSGDDPPLAIQAAVAKQMHAVVLLYNYYHRKQNPGLEFLEFEAFCNLVVSLKPAMIAHLKYINRTKFTGSDEKENHLSVTEKAVKDACKLSSGLIALKDFSVTEGWPIAKVSVLLVDSNKENCLLQFSSITNGVWSVIEKHISNRWPENLSEGKRPTKRRKMGEKVLMEEETDEELAFRQFAFSAVEEATGISQSGLMVLDRHVVYSLGEENMAAYFYIVQCTQSSNEDFQVPIKDVIESLQGPLLKRNSGSWTLTPKTEYYDMLPYAQKMSCWLSREGFSACSQALNFISSESTGNVSQREAAEIEKVNLNGLNNFSAELGYVNVDGSQGLRKPCDGKVLDNRESINCSSTREPTGAGSSNRKEKEDEAKEKPDKGDVLGNVNVDGSQGLRKPCGVELLENRESINCSSTIEPTGAGSSNRKEKEDEAKEKPDKEDELGSANVDGSQGLRKPCDGKVLENRESINCSSTIEPTGGVGSSNRKEKEDDAKKKPDKEDELGNVNVDGSQGLRKPCDGKVPQKRESINCSTIIEPTGAGSSNMKEKEDEAKEKPDKEDDGRKSTAADSSNGKEKEDDEKERPDKCCDITNSKSRCLSNAVPGAPEMTSTEELQISPKDADGFGLPDPKNGGKHKNFSVPMKVYYHQKRKLSAENIAGSSVSVTRHDMEHSDPMKSNDSELTDGKVAGICIERLFSSPVSETTEAVCSLVPYETDAKDAGKLQTVLATKESVLSETALRVLLQKIENMCHQQRDLEDKIALCRRDVQKIIEGNEDTLGLKLEAILDCCNDVCLKGKCQIQGGTYQQVEIHKRVLRKDRPSEPILTLHSRCQELDYICHVNRWRLPSYSVSASIGGFIASVTIKEADFDFACEGALLSTPCASRDSAAELMIGKLRGMAGQT